ncbi:hypothetical protein FRC11_000869 [Ceratobasidium sp. 423]|nr:hypothetical protein FRC11_000869 [Ceratobasidium sp. 423]
MQQPTSLVDSAASSPLSEDADEIFHDACDCSDTGSSIPTSICPTAVEMGFAGTDEKNSEGNFTGAYGALSSPTHPLANPAPSAPASSPRSGIIFDKKAVLIALNYEHRGRVDQRLHRASRDIRYYADVMTQFGYSSKDMRVVTDEQGPSLASYDYVIECMDWLVKDASEGDHLSFTFSGYCLYPAGHQEPALVMADFMSISRSTLQERLVAKVPVGVELTIALYCHHPACLRQTIHACFTGEHKTKQTNEFKVLSELMRFAASPHSSDTQAELTRLNYGGREDLWLQHATQDARRVRFANTLSGHRFPTGSSRRAVLIGLDYEQCTEKIFPSQTATDAAHRFTNTLTKLGYSDENVKVVTDERSQPPITYKSLIECMEWLVQDVSEGDCLFFMFSGHFSFHMGREPYLVTADFRPISWTILQERLVAKVPAGAELIIVLDRCHSAGMVQWKYCIGRMGDRHEIKQTDKRGVLSELGLHQEQDTLITEDPPIMRKISITGDLQPQSTLISHATPLTEVVDFLIKHNCKDITPELDFERSSPESLFRGGFGAIHKGELRSGQLVAIKCVEVLGSWGAWTPMEKSLKHSAHEIYAWSKCNHPGILPLFGFARYKEHILLISPWMKNGSLVHYIAKHPQRNRIQLSVELSSAVAYLHSKGIAHGDIKADNVIISDDGHVQLGDFGSAILLNYPSSAGFTQTGFKGTLRFMAPELLANTSNTHTVKSDIYALGMTIFYILTGQLPFADQPDFTIPIEVVMKRNIPTRPNFNGILTSQTAKDKLWKVKKALAKLE